MGRRGFGGAARIALCAVKVAVLSLVLLGSAGCGVITAITNPSAGWALSEPAPMSVIVRRAEVARVTADEVARLLGDTGVDDKSKWAAKTALKKADAEALLKEIGGEPVYAGVQGVQIRIIPAEAWARTLSLLCSEESDHNSLLEALSPDAAKSYEAIAEGENEIAKLKEQIGERDKEIEAEGTTDAAKAELEKKKEALQAQIDKLEEAHAPKVEAFLTKLKDEAGKAPAETKARLGGVLVNLQRAVEDAKIASAVALLRYPLALPGMTDDVQSAAKRIAADIIEEQTGSRPDLSGLKPDVSLEGTDVKLTLNGVPAEKLGDISPGKLVEETTSRLTSYMERVLTLPAYIDTTQDKLTLETDILGAAIEAMGLDPAKAEGAGEDLAELSVTSAPAGAGAAKKGKDEGETKRAAGERTPGGLLATSCEGPSGGGKKMAKKPAKEDEEEDADDADDAKVVKSPGKKASGKKPAAEAKAVGEAKPSGEAKQVKRGRSVGDDEEATRPTVVRTGGPPPAKPAAPAPPPSRPPAAEEKPCNGVVVTNGNTKMCL